MSLPVHYFTNNKTRMCRVISGRGPDHTANLLEAEKDGFKEVTPFEFDDFRAETQKAKDAGWNPNRMRYATFMAKQAAK
jgi:hypothetical protein